MHTTLIAATLTVLALGGCTLPDDAKSSTAQPPDASSPAGPSSSSPNAEAKLSGTCDYDLGDSAMGADYTMSAEIVVKNTGNVDVRVKATARWPQFGHAPISATKTVDVPVHKRVTIRFARHATQTQIDRLQSYQLKHDDNDGCSYSGKILS